MDKQYWSRSRNCRRLASLDRTEAVTRHIAEIGLKQPGVAHAVEFAGIRSMDSPRASSAGLIFLSPLEDFPQRNSRALSGPRHRGGSDAKMASIQTRSSWW